MSACLISHICYMKEDFSQDTLVVLLVEVTSGTNTGMRPEHMLKTCKFHIQLSAHTGGGCGGGGS